MAAQVSGQSARCGRIGEQRIERDLGALKRHGHAVAGERRDHGAGVAEGDAVRGRNLAVELHGGDGTERLPVKIGPGQPVGQDGQFRRPQIGEQQSRALGGQFATAEQAAHIHAAVLHPGEPDIGLRAQMKLEITTKGEVARMDFQPEPGRRRPGGRW